MKKLLFLILLVPGLALAEQYPNTHCVSATPTIDTAAYATGDYMGTAVLTFTGALKSTTNSGYLTSVEITDKAAQAVAFDVVVFTDNPAATTFTDNAAFDPDDTDLTKIAGVVNVPTTSHFTFSDNSTHFVTVTPIPVEGGRISGTPSSTVYGALVARGAYDGTTASDVTVILCFSQD